MASTNNDETIRKILLLYNRPQEPLFRIRGTDKTVFNVPTSYLPDRYRNISDDTMCQYANQANEKIDIPNVNIPPLGDILDLERDGNFSLFIGKHRRIAGRLISLLYGAKDLDTLLAMAVYVRDRINPYLFNYGLTVVLLHRSDTGNVQIPNLFSVFPAKFIDHKVLASLRTQANLDTNDLIELPLNYTASDLEPEQRVAYFREDIAINSHHWHWHLVYPFEGPMEVVAKDRRGELFYYMHQQVLARYNCERFSNGLPRVTKYDRWQAPIPEAYFPKLTSMVAKRAWPARTTNETLTNLNRDHEEIHLEVDDLIRWRDRIMQAIQSGRMKNDKGQTIDLMDTNGIDLLGNTIEASLLSVNRNYYGDFHNSGHIMISYVHDPDGRYLESFGVMGDTATAMRDPIFYRWHGYIDQLLRLFKSTLKPYCVNELDFRGITVKRLYVQCGESDLNSLWTFWEKSDADLSMGLDFQPHGPFQVRFTHLQHENFTYYLVIQNDTCRQMNGTCRIFIAPKFDESGRCWSFADQRSMFIELDRYRVTLKPGTNNLTRNSTDSTITIPFEQTFGTMNKPRPTSGPEVQDFNYCGCGWPHHMLLPKGTTDGLRCQLFVMISDYDYDMVKQSDGTVCSVAGSYCGIRDKLYPDLRGMGYPFDRAPRDNVRTLDDFLTGNMAVQDVTVYFTGRIVGPK